MNKYDLDVLRAVILNEGNITQRKLSLLTGHSLGRVNHSLVSLRNAGIITNNNKITNLGIEISSCWKPDNAIILAAGYGLRMVPLNTEIPKGLLEVNGEPLIERTIKQLHEAGVQKIFIVVGYQKEKYEYLIDEYGVELIINMDYSTKNNLFSLQKAAAHLGNSYIIPCDLYCQNNPYNKCEPYDWYMVSDRMTTKSIVKISRSGDLISITSNEAGNAMLGISYITEETSQYLRNKLIEWCSSGIHDDNFWDDVLFALPNYHIHGKIVKDTEFVEIDTFEQLRNLDHNSEQLHTSAIEIITKTFHTEIDQITDITILKKGMTNRSFLFTCQGKRYIMRIPGEGTDMLINRREEASVYNVLNGLDICDDVMYMNPDNGYKITRYIEDSRTCNPYDENDLNKCMRVLRKFHHMNLQVSHTFNVFDQINYYESLWRNSPSVYRDYSSTKEHVLSLRSYIDSQEKPYCLTHIDAVPDNFLIYGSESNETIRLIDWEYAGMQDPHIDVAMFCIYSLYNKEHVDQLIDIYFEGKCPHLVRIKIYCYIAACGLLWSNWCEYKAHLGVEFGEYALRQYRYAKDYYKYAVFEMEKI